MSATDGRMGIALLILFMVGGAARDVMVKGAFAGFGFFEVAAIAFGTASAAFLLLLALRAPRQIGVFARRWRMVVTLNVTTATAWLAYFAALDRIDAAVANTVFVGIAPLAVALWGAVGLAAHAGARVGGRERCVHGAMAATLGVLATGVIDAATDARVAATGIAFALIAGVAISAESILAKRMNEAGVSAAAVLGVRFLLVAAVAGAAVQAGGGFGGSAAGTARVAALAGLLIVLPIYCVQLGLKLTSPITTSVVLALGPLFVLAAERLAAGGTAGGPVLAAILAYGALAVLAAWLRATRREAAA